jgi:hypothetical protein
VLVAVSGEAGRRVVVFGLGGTIAMGSLDVIGPTVSITSRPPTAMTCHLDFTIHVPRPGGPRLCSIRQRSVLCTRPPGIGTRSAAQSPAIISWRRRW